jgi:hypothetical protein
MQLPFIPIMLQSLLDHRNREPCGLLRVRGYESGNLARALSKIDLGSGPEVYSKGAAFAGGEGV